MKANFCTWSRSRHIQISSEKKIREYNLQFVKHAQKKLIWDCFSYYGVAIFQPIEEMMR